MPFGKKKNASRHNFFHAIKLQKGFGNPIVKEPL